MPAPLKHHGPAYQKAVLTILTLGSAMSVTGAVLSFAAGTKAPAFVVLGGAAGLLIVVTGMGLAHGLPLLSFLDRNTSGGSAYDRRRIWGRLKVAAVLLNLLVFLAVMVLLGALLHRLGLLQADFAGATVGRFAHILLAGLVSSMLASTYLALRSPNQRDLRPLEHVLFVAACVASMFLTASAAGLLTVPSRSGQFLFLRALDAPFILLAAATAAALAASVSRRLPNLYTVATQQPGTDQRAGYVSRHKSVVLPIVVAMALLLLMFFTFIAFEIGLSGLAFRVPRSGLLLLTTSLILIAFFTSVGVALSLVRAPSGPALFRTRRSIEARRQAVIVWASGGVSLILAAASLLVFTGSAFWHPQHRAWIDLAVFSFLAAAGPYGFYGAMRAKRIRKMEEKFPDFLRDLAAGRHAGLTFESALATAAKGEYGALTTEIQKMSDQLSWHVPFEEVLLALADRVRTPLIERAVSVIVSAGRTGGQVTEILTSVASDVREIKNLEVERRSAMGLYTVVVYVIFAVFLLTIAVLYGTFLPKTLEASAAAGKIGATGAGGISFVSLPLESFRTFYFLAVIAQGIGTGLVGGVLETGRWVGGLRHAFLMVLLGWVTFTWII